MILKILLGEEETSPSKPEVVIINNVKYNKQLFERFMEISECTDYKDKEYPSLDNVKTTVVDDRPNFSDWYTELKTKELDYDWDTIQEDWMKTNIGLIQFLKLNYNIPTKK
jgi:hypothetical protein